MTNRSHPLFFAVASLCLVACEGPTDDMSLRAAGPGVADLDFGITEYVCDDDMLDELSTPLPGSQSPVGGRECDYVANIDRVADPSSTVDPARCASLRNRARDLIARHGSCELDTQCDTFTAAEANIADTCLGAFECYVPLREGTDLEAFARRARQLDALYVEAGCSCPVAMCTDPDRTLSVCEAGTCRLDVATAPDRLRL